MKKVSLVPLETLRIHEINIWLWLDLNLRPWAYESPALTTELQNLILFH